MGPLRRLQNASGHSRIERGVVSAMLKDMNDPLNQRNITRVHLEHQMASSLALHSTREYHYWFVLWILQVIHISTNGPCRLQAYARFLASDEDVVRLEVLCAELLGSFHATPSSVCTNQQRAHRMELTVDDIGYSVQPRTLTSSSVTNYGNKPSIATDCGQVSTNVVTH